MIGRSGKEEEEGEQAEMGRRRGRRVEGSRKEKGGEVEQEEIVGEEDEEAYFRFD